MNLISGHQPSCREQSSSSSLLGYFSHSRVLSYCDIVQHRHNNIQVRVSEYYFPPPPHKLKKDKKRKVA